MQIQVNTDRTDSRRLLASGELQKINNIVPGMTVRVFDRDGYFDYVEPTTIKLPVVEANNVA